MNTENPPITTIIFDMDNTLFDLVGAQHAACKAVVSHLDHKDWEALFSLFLTTTHGFESHENIRDYLCDQQLFTPETYAATCRIYDSEKLRFITPYPGVRETLATLRQLGYPMGIVTDAEQKDATLRLDKCGFLSLFDCVVTSDIVKKKKPAPEPFLHALTSLNVTPAEVLVIGDSPRRDIEPCRALGIRTAYARYGDRFSGDREICHADFVLDHMSQLPGLLNGYLPR